MEEEKEEVRRQAEAAAEAAMADAIAGIPPGAPSASPPTPPAPPHQFVEAVSEIIGSGDSLPDRTRRPRPSIEQATHDYVVDLEETRREEESRTDGASDGGTESLKIQMDNLKEDLLDALTNQARIMDRALEHEQAETDAKVSTLNAALEAAENDKLELKKRHEAELEKQRSEFAAERDRLNQEVSDKKCNLKDVRKETGHEVSTMKDHFKASQLKLATILPAYNGSRDKTDVEDPLSVSAGNALYEAFAL